jgi:hypothetical protein
MRRHAVNLRVLTALLTIAGSAAYSGDLETGTVVQVKPNAIWFEERAALAEWQRLKASDDQEALQAYEARVLSERQAWQFTVELEVKILGTDPTHSQFNVEMKTPSRLQGTMWYLDADALLH